MTVSAAAFPFFAFILVARTAAGAGAAPPVLKPPPLRPGDLVVLVGPASPARSTEVEEAAGNLRRMGYRVKVAGQATAREGYLAGGDDERAAAVNAAFADPEARLVLCVRGGYGSPRILDRIDYSLVRRSPKAIVGYSDITALLIAIRQRAGVVTFHGPMAGPDFSGRRGPAPAVEQHLFVLLGGDPFRPDAPPFPDWGAGVTAGGGRRTIRGGVAEGPIIGGNLSTVASLLGTPYEIDTRGAILFLEDVNEEPFRIDRMLCQLRLAGKLAGAAGVLLGGFTRCEAKSPRESFTVSAVLDAYFRDLGVPALAGFPAGHLPQQAALPFGVRVRLDATARTLAILEAAVEEPGPKVEATPEPVGPPVEGPPAGRAAAGSPSRG